MSSNSGKKLKSYTSLKSSAMSSTKSRSPISVKNIEVEKKIETVFELIDKLPQDIKEEVFSKLMSFNSSNSNSKNLPLINKQFADYYSRTRKLSRIQPPENLTIKKLPKITEKIVDAIGDLKFEKILKYSPVVRELQTIIENSNYENLCSEDDYLY